ncbi:MAG: DPP IV N-terminal domain-containing protein [Anaerolineae bacterium]
MWAVGLAIWCALVLLMLAAQAIGVRVDAPILGYVSSSDVYYIDVEHHIALNTGVHHAAVGGGVWSPDLRRMAFVDTRRNTIMSVDLESGTLQALTDADSQALSPQWSPDGSRLAYISDVDGDFEIYVLDFSSGAVQQVTDNDIPDTGCLWLPDGRRIIYAAIFDQRIVMTVVDVDSRAVQPIPQVTAADQLPVWSADGRQFAYTTWVGEGTEIYVADVVTGEARLLYTLPTLNGLLLRWSADARYLSFFLNAEIYVLDVQTGERVGLMGSGARLNTTPCGRPMAVDWRLFLTATGTTTFTSSIWRRAGCKPSPTMTALTSIPAGCVKARVQAKGNEGSRRAGT